ncbi:uncharacterized mitochondrial protein AtMg00860-like [Aristolochia californica]|uniref:uncharacterized mitochondrial protein AtMg00860-like n=1 Tax=Aristolochia californica TaxID=171875 RepID=UPI0035DA148F
MSKSVEEHLTHMRIIFDLLRAHQLYLKHSKCSFATSHVGYLGHIISHEGVTVDPEKIRAIHQWQQPQSCSALRGIFGSYGLLPQIYSELWASGSTIDQTTQEKFNYLE